MSIEFGKYYVATGNFENEPPEAEVQDESDEPERGKELGTLLNCLTYALLRCGFLIQLCVIITGYGTYLSNHGLGFFSFDLFGTPEDLRNDSKYVGIMMWLQSLFVCGSISLAAFQIFLADDARQNRGFRAGSKMLSTAATLDIFVGSLRLMQYVYAYNFLGQRWWLKYIQSPSDWCLFYSGTFLHSIVLFLYGFGIFYMESYHTKSSQSGVSCLCLLLYTIASVFELLSAFTHYGGFSTMFHMISLFLATIWSCSFEETVYHSSPMFHDRNVNSGISDESTRAPSSKAASVVSSEAPSYR